MSTESQGGDFWGKGGGGGDEVPKKPARPAPGDAEVAGEEAFWGTPAKKNRPMKEASVPLEPVAKSKRRRKCLIWTGAGLVAGLGVLVIGGPTIAGMFAPWLVPKFAGLSGKLEVSDASFGWFGGQRLGTTKLFDLEGKEIARGKVTIEHGLFGIMTGNMNLGAVKLEGKADVVRYADGSTNLQKALAPKAPGAPGKETSASATNAPIQMPKGLALVLDASGLELTFVDAGSPKTATAPARSPVSVSLTGMNVSATVKNGQPLAVRFDARAKGAGSGAGAIKGSLSVDGWSDAAGKLTFDPARPMAADALKVDLNLELTDVPVALADAALSMGDRLATGLGDKATAKIGVKGGVNKADATLSFDSTGAKASAKLAIVDGVVTSSGPIDASVAGKAIQALVPKAAELCTPSPTAPMVLSAMPDVVMTIQGLRAKLPTGSAAMDLRGVAGDVSVKTTGTTGKVRLQGTGPADKAFAIAPLDASVKIADLATGATLKAATSATIDAKPAGTIDIDLTTGTLVDAKGQMITGIPGGLAGKFEVKGVATAIAQPFLDASMPIDLPQDVGPTLDIALIAKSTGGAVAAGTIPPADIDLSIKSERIDASGLFTFADGSIKSRGEGFKADVKSAAQIAQRTLGDKPAWALSPAGQLSMSVTGIDIALDKEHKPLLDQSAAKIVMNASAWTVRPTSDQDNRGGGPLAAMQVQMMGVEMTLAPGKPTVATAKGTMSYDGSPFRLDASAEFADLFKGDGKSPINMASAMTPVAHVRIADAPTSPANFRPQSAPAPASPASPLGTPASPPMTPQQLVALIRDAVGSTVTLTLDSTPSKTEKDGIDARATVEGANLNVAMDAGVSKAAVDLRSLTATTRMTPQLAETLKKQFAPGNKDLPRLASGTEIKLTVDPIRLALNDKMKPDLAASKGTVGVKITSPTGVLVDGLTLAEAGKPARPLGTTGLQDLAASLSVPLNIAMSDLGARGPVKGSLQGRVVRAGGMGGPVGVLTASLDGDVEVQPAGIRPLGIMTMTSSLKDASTAAIDELSGKPGMLAGALGDAMSVDAKVVLTPSVDGDLAKATIAAEASLTAPLLKTAAPLRVDVLPDRISMREPATFTWTPDTVWLNKMLAGPPEPAGGLPGRPVKAAAARLTKPLTVNVSLDKAVVSKGDAMGAFKTGVFDLMLAITVPNVELAASDGTTTKLTGVSVGLERAESGVRFRTEIGEATAGNAPAARGIKLQGTVANLADAKGNLTPDAAIVTASGDLPALPTALLDALAKQNGRLVEALGPLASLKIDADKFGKSGGKLDVTARSSRADLTVKGSVANESFTTTRESPMRITVMEVTPELSASLVKAIPFFGKIEKKATDLPGHVVASDLHVPLDNDLTKLNADINIVPGDLTFETSPEFARLLSAANQKTEGKAGQKLEPMTVAIRSGVARIQRWPLPLGEFKIEMEGTYNLVTKDMDFITWVPFGALSEDVAKGLQGPLGAAVGDRLLALAVPIRTRGNANGRQTQVDTEAFLKDAVKLFKPEDLLKQGVEQGLKDLLKGKK
ncbi:MAG: hypothetical protein AABZ53_07240 [Planctomycetota bacterium]